MTRVLENIGAPEPSKEHQCAAAIEELITEFGLRSFLSSLSFTKASEAVGVVTHQAALRVTQAIIREIVFRPNPQLEAEIIALGSGILLADGTTMTRIGAKHGISRAAVSKRVVEFCESNGLPPSTYMRPAKDRKTYAETNRREKIPSIIR